MKIYTRKSRRRQSLYNGIMKTYEKDFSFVKTKADGLDKKFNLSDPAGRAEYFKAKAGAEIEAIKKYLEHNTFIAYFLGKKNSGKGTYSKLMKEVFGEDKIGHISVGDIVRDVHEALADETKKAELMKFLEKNYRGYISVDDAVSALLSRDTKSLLPTEFILALIKMEISKLPKKSLFIDGFPRELDQISYSLFLSDLIDYRSDLDIFVAISIPEAVLDERMKFRVVCPVCHTPRNLKLLATKEVGYDADNKRFYLKCDNPSCSGARMVGKEGDELGIETIRERLELDEKLIEKVFTLHGVPRILLRNALPADSAGRYVDDYEITPEFVYELGGDGKVKVSERSWTIKDDEGVESYSLMAPAVALALIKQLAEVIKKQNPGLIK